MVPKSLFDPIAFLEKVGKGKTVTIYKAGTVIYKQGDPANSVFYLQSGSVKETVARARQREKALGLLRAGHFFGTGCLDGSRVRPSTTRAMERSVITEITAKTMKAALTEPALNQLFIAYLLQHNSLMERERINLLFQPHEKRLARHLAMLGTATSGVPEVIGPHITQEFLADLIGTTRQRVNYYLSKFAQLGYIEKSRGGIVVKQALVKSLLYDDNDKEYTSE
jgi:CRP-like cAMP-binding protein